MGCQTRQTPASGVRSIAPRASQDLAESKLLEQDRFRGYVLGLGAQGPQGTQTCKHMVTMTMQAGPRMWGAPKGGESQGGCFGGGGACVKSCHFLELPPPLSM